MSPPAVTDGGPGPSRRRTVLGAAAMLAGAVLTLVVGAAPAAAHDVLTGTVPAGSSSVGRTPAQVVLTFDQPAVAMGTRVLVSGPSGPVQTGSARLVDNTVTQDVQGGAPPGAYTVTWRVTSADGHPVSGTFTFTSSEAGAGTPAAMPTPTPDDVPADLPGAPTRPALVGSVVPAVVPAVVLAVIVVVSVRRRRP